MLVCPEEKLSVRRSQGTVGECSVKGVDGNELKLWVGAKDEGLTGLVWDVNRVARQRHRTPRFLLRALAAHALGEFHFAGF